MTKRVFEEKMLNCELQWHSTTEPLASANQTYFFGYASVNGGEDVQQVEESGTERDRRARSNYVWVCFKPEAAQARQTGDDLQARII